MIHVAQICPGQTIDPLLQAMFEARKRVFVDLLKWDVPVVEGRFEIDQFDTEAARYVLVLDGDGAHLASARLLPTDRPHILSDLFPHLCNGPVPRGTRTMEITRFCLDRRVRGAERRQARNRLVSALVRDGLEHGISCYTGVADIGWLQQILAFGWKSRPLGLPRIIDGHLLGALSIDIDTQTPSLLTASGIWVNEPVQTELRRAA